MTLIKHIQAIPAFEDNYLWLITDPDGQYAAVVDPGDAAPVLATLKKQSLELSAILITHGHGDHVGGVVELKQHFPAAKVYGPSNERIPACDVTLKGGNVVNIPNMPWSLSVWDVPGHTAGHIAYLGDGAFFCGDTLFGVGCGRVFSGTMAQMQQALARIRELPDSTRVYCAHEYTLSNIRFARQVEPKNLDLKAHETTCRVLRDMEQATVPLLMAQEKAVNPFLRTHLPQVQKMVAEKTGHSGDEVDVFTGLRLWKDGQF